MWVQVLLERVVLVYVMAKQEPFVEGKFTCVPYTVLYKVSKRFPSGEASSISAYAPHALLPIFIMHSSISEWIVLLSRYSPFCYVVEATCPSKLNRNHALWCSVEIISQQSSAGSDYEHVS